MQRVDCDPVKQHFTDAKICCRELSQKSLNKKPNWLWRLILLLVLGLSGMYICISGVEKRVMDYKATSTLPVVQNFQVNTRCSSEMNSRNDIVFHYPQPSTFDREECSCTPVHNFVLFSMQRSGSGWFETLLNSHPNVSSHGEVFSTSRRESASSIKATLDKLYNLEWVSSASKNECTTAVGLKWMLNQGVMEFKKEVSDYLEEKSVSVIFLFRRNILRRYVSILANSFDRYAKQLNGTHRAHVHSKEEANILAAYKPIVNLNSLIEYLHRVEEIINDAINSFSVRRHLLIYYEDLVVNPNEQLRRAQDFLGVPHTKLESKHVKIHTRPLNEQIQNWAELSKFLEGTKYEAFLRESDYT